MARNPAQAGMFAHISQLGVELKYAEDCNVDNMEALDWSNQEFGQSLTL